MNLHMTRRLEVLAKEIAAAKSPKIDAEANARFLVNTSVMLPSGVSTFISEADCQQFKGAATCKASGDKHVAPGAAPPSPQAEQPAPKFSVGDRIRVTLPKNNTTLCADCEGWLGTVQGPSKVFPGDFACLMDQKPGFDVGGKLSHFTARELTLAPSQEAAKGDAEGWVKHIPGPAPTGLGRLLVRFKDGKEVSGEAGEFFRECWTHEGSQGNHVVAYRMCKP
jgi:hypothetical protein